MNEAGSAMPAGDAPVTSARNPAVQQLAAYVAQTRMRRRDGVAVLEGVHLVQAWLAAGARTAGTSREAGEPCPPDRASGGETHAEPPCVLWIAHECCDEPEVAALGAAAARAGVPVRSALRRVLGRASSMPSAPPVVAVVPLPRPPLPAGIRTDVLVLHAVQDPANVGAIIRTAAAAGIGRIVATPGTADAWSPKALRAGMGGQFAVHVHEDVPWDAVRVALRVPSAGLVVRGGQPLHRADLRGPRAWLFGSEGQGLDAGVQATLAERWTIDQQPAVESLNVAAAVAVCLFEQRRQRTVMPTRTSAPS